MPAHRSNGSRLLLALSAAAALGSCQGLFDSSTSARITLDVGGLVGGQQGDFTSVVERAELTIRTRGTEGNEGVVQTLTQAVAPDEPEAIFEVEIEDGEWTFAAEVFSTNGTLLYQGATVATIDADDFAVTIVPQPVNPVLVVLPRRPPFIEEDDFEIHSFTAFMRVRNPGLSGLTWRVDSAMALPQGVRVLCRLFQQDLVSCLVDRTWAAGQDEIIQVIFEMPSGTGTLPAGGIRFVSNVGNLTVPTTP